ncbi:MAG: hypothetical protein HY904_00760 [Deltaproteobacteria bacterium]|nr:hypothetical protein [Deltaproteobacteria bacterium]
MVTPTLQCGACVTGYTEATPGGACRPYLTCSDLSCGTSTCIAVTNGDAYCDNGCGATQARTTTGQCVNCNCDTTQDPGLAGGHWPDASPSEGRCVCQTKPGYFFHRLGVSYPCDADHDGWLRIAAKDYMDKPATDPERKSARCGELVGSDYQVRTIDRFVLENEAAQSQVMTVTPTALYEPDRIDDPVLLSQAPARDFPAYGTGRNLRPEELNPLTKACVGTLADFNQNTIADVAEWQNPIATDLFSQFAYFVELDRGWYEPPGTGETYGSYHIREKSRQPGSQDGTRLALQGAAAGTYWRDCARRDDTTYDPSKVGTTMDFCRASTGGVTSCQGMRHHSQFKCAQIVDTPPPPTAPAPQQWTAAQVRQTPGAGGYPNTFNACSASGASPGPVAGTTNPSDPALDCTPDNTLTTGKVGFIVVGFDVYNYPSEYVRGCVDECKETMASCPACQFTQTQESCAGWDADPVLNRSMCGEDNGQLGYGKLVCGCGPNLGNVDCDLGCPASDLHSNRTLSANLDNGSGRAGYWMCGQFTATSYTTPEPQLSGGGYVLRGKVPVAPVERTPLTGGSYTLR